MGNLELRKITLKRKFKIMESKETNQSEKTFYQDQNVTVTNLRFLARGKHMQREIFHLFQIIK